MGQPLDKEAFYETLLEKYKDTPQYWHHLAYLGKYSVLVDRIIQIDTRTLEITFFGGTDVKDIGTVLYDLHTRTDYTTFATFNGVKMEVKSHG